MSQEASLPVMQPGFGVPNRFQETHVREGLHDSTASFVDSDRLPGQPDTGPIFEGAMDALGLHGKEKKGENSSEGASRHVRIEGLPLNIKGLHTESQHVSTDVSISDTFLFARSDPNNPNSAPRRIRETEVVIKPQQGQDGLPKNKNGHNFIPLNGVKHKGGPERDGHGLNHYPVEPGYDTADQGSEVRVKMLDGKPFMVSWVAPDTPRATAGNHLGRIEKNAGLVMVRVDEMPRLFAEDAQGRGNGNVRIADNILRGVEKMFEGEKPKSEAEKARRHKAAEDAGKVAAHSQARIDAIAEEWMERDTRPDSELVHPF